MYLCVQEHFLAGHVVEGPDRNQLMSIKYVVEIKENEDTRV